MDRSHREGLCKMMTSRDVSVASNETEEPIDFGRLEHRSCICGGKIYRFVLKTEERWICERCCGAAGASYEDAVLEKISLDAVRDHERIRHFLIDAHLLP